MSRRRFLALLLLAATALGAAASSVAAFAPGAGLTGRQWEPLDLVFTAPTPAGTNPFDLAFSVTFTGPDGDTRLVPGFYDGADRHMVRFAPPAPGDWSFTSSSAHPALHGLAGRVTVAPAPADEPGPVMVRPGHPRQFAHAGGRPYFAIAYEVDWLFALDAEDPAGIPKTETLLRQIAANGFNQVIFNVYAYDVPWPRDPRLDPRHDYGRPRVFPFGGDNTRPDHGTLSVEFFQRIDRVMAALRRHGLVAHLMIYVWNKNAAWPPARSADDDRYFDYVVKRYQAFPHLIWDISKEATGYGRDDRGYITERIVRLRALDAHRRLVTVHDYGYCAAFPDQVDFISIQNWRSELWQVMMDVRAKFPGKPALNIEHGGYERGPYHVFDGSYLDPAVCLERAYLSVFAGAYPTHYWQDTAWNVIIHDPAALPEADRPKLHYYRHLADFAAAHAVWDLAPDPARSTSGFCLSDGRQRFVYLVPKENSSIVVLPPKGARGELHATWFDPLTGETRAEAPRGMAPYLFYTHPAPGRLALLVVQVAAAP